MQIKRVALLSGSLLLLLLVAAATVPFLIPKSVYRAQIEKAATAALQREVRLSGDVRLSIFPRLAARVTGVTVANPAGFEGPYMVEADELRGAVAWAPLFARRVEIEELAFVNASVSLEKLADGRTNWVLDTSPPAAPGEQKPQGFNGGVTQARLTKASVAYRDRQTGAQYLLSELDLTASMAATDKPLRVQAEGYFQTQPFDLDLTLDSLQAMSARKPVKIDTRLGTDFFDITYNGTVLQAEQPILDASFTARTDALPALAGLSGISVPVDLGKIGRVRIEGRLSGPVDALIIRIAEFSQDSDLAETSFAGEIRLGTSPALRGEASFDVPSLSALTDFAGIDPPVKLAPLGRAKGTVNLSGPLDRLALNIPKVTLQGPLIDASYAGAVTLGPVPDLDGKVEARVKDGSALAQGLGLNLPQAGIMDRLSFSAKIKGPADAPTLTGTYLAHEGELLTASFEGGLSLADGGRIDGDLSATSNQLRALLAALGTELAPGTQLQRFAASGQVIGSFHRISLAGLDLTVDDIRAKGSAGLDLAGPKPKVFGNLDMGLLDLSPFLSSADARAKPGPKIAPWSKDQLDLAGLMAADADLQINASQLTLGDIVLTDAALTASLANGKLLADLTRFKAFGGNWSGRLTLDASSPRPALAAAMTGDGVSISSLLGTFTGFDRLTGAGAFKLDITSSGRSLDELVRGLNGGMSTKLTNGALRGFNAGQMVRSAQSLQQALSAGNLQSIDFGSVLSPSAETDFTQFDTVLSIENGVATVDLMKMLNPLLGVDGTGRIDIGGQALDLRLATAIDRRGQGQGSVVQLNGIPVPVRLSGGWNNIRITPDFSGVQAALQAEFGARAKQEVTGRLGDAASGVIGGVLGAPSRPAGDGTAPATPPAAASPRDQVEDAARDAAREALGGIINRRRPKPPADQAPPTASEAAPQPSQDPASEAPPPVETPPEGSDASP